MELLHLKCLFTMEFQGGLCLKQIYIYIYLKNKDMLNLLHHGTRKFYMIKESMSA